AARDWLADREAELLPVPSFPVVFTLPAADSDEAGRLFQGEAGHLFRFHSGQCSDLKPDTLLV
ncbi:MAG: hypothetical protein ACJ8DB_13745, partial [Microvirga sp.]